MVPGWLPAPLLSWRSVVCSPLTIMSNAGRTLWKPLSLNILFMISANTLPPWPLMPTNWFGGSYWYFSSLLSHKHTHIFARSGGCFCFNDELFLQSCGPSSPPVWICYLGDVPSPAWGPWVLSSSVCLLLGPWPHLPTWRWIMVCPIFP